MFAAALALVEAAACSPDAIAAARAQAEEGHFNAALQTLGVPPKEDYDCRMIEARIYGWNGDGAEARRLLEAIETDFGEDGETRLLRAQLHYYAGEFEAASADYRLVLAGDPQNAEAAAGLERLRRMASPAESLSKKSWRFDAGAEYSAISRSPQEDWKLYYAAIGRRMDAGVLRGVSGAVRRYRQFGAGDIEVEGGIGAALPGAGEIALGFAAAPDAEFRPDWAVSLDAKTPIHIGAASLALYGVARYRYAAYEVGNVSTIAPGLELAGGDVWGLRVRMIAVVEHEGASLFGWDARAERQLAGPVRIAAGYAIAPETIAGQSVKTKSVFVQTGIAITEDLSLNISASRDKRRDDFIRNAIHAGLAVRF